MLLQRSLEGFGKIEILKNEIILFYGSNYLLSKKSIKLVSCVESDCFGSRRILLQAGETIAPYGQWLVYTHQIGNC